MPVPSTKYKHESSCNLFNPDHKIDRHIGRLLEALQDEDILVAACGCGSCFTTDKDEAVFYIAQDRGTQHELYLKYDVSEEADISRVELGQKIRDKAEDQGLEVDWDGTSMKAVKVIV